MEESCKAHSVRFLEQMINEATGDYNESAWNIEFAQTKSEENDAINDMIDALECLVYWKKELYSYYGLAY